MFKLAILILTLLVNISTALAQDISRGINDKEKSLTPGGKEGHGTDDDELLAFNNLSFEGGKEGHGGGIHPGRNRYLLKLNRYVGNELKELLLQKVLKQLQNKVKLYSSVQQLMGKSEQLENLIKNSNFVVDEDYVRGGEKVFDSHALIQLQNGKLILFLDWDILNKSVKFDTVDILAISISLYGKYLGLSEREQLTLQDDVESILR